MKKKTRAFPVKTAVGIAAAATGAVVWLAFGKGKLIPMQAYTVQRVIDGDTFVTAENQYVRVAGIQAPEMGFCGADEAKKELEKLVMGKPIYFKMIFSDQYNRMVSLVYTGDGYVNEEMLKKGYATYAPRTSTENLGDLKDAGAYAREHKLGIFSTECTQLTNPDSPSCNIKGNVRNGKIYYLPDCGVYHNTSVQLYMGDRWFCSEKEAIAAGFRKPAQCP